MAGQENQDSNNAQRPSNGEQGHYLWPRMNTPEWLSAIAAIAAAVAAIAGVIIAFQTRGVLQGQLTAMRGQLEQMQSASSDTKDLVTATKNFATAMKEQANGTAALVDQAKRSAGYANSSAQVAEGQLQEMRLEQRPFVQVMGVHYIPVVSPFLGDPEKLVSSFANGNVERSVASAYQVMLQWQNSGNSPATDLVVETNCRISFVDKISDDFDHLQNGETGPVKSTGVLGPKQISDIGGCIIRPVDMMMTEWATKDIAVYGTVTYRGPHSRSKYITEFCRKLTGITGNIHYGEVGADNMGFTPINGYSVPCPTHNCSDEQCRRHANN